MVNQRRPKEVALMIFVGDDWAEDHHDMYLMDEANQRLVARRLSEGLSGIRGLHELIAAHVEEPRQVMIGIETDRGLWVSALAAAGYQVWAINPMAADRYRDRHHVSGAKSDAGNAKLLADVVRTDRHNHRQIAGDTPDAEAINVLPAPIKARSGHARGMPTCCAVDCGSTTPPPWRPSIPSPIVTRWRC
jgi:Transposase